MRQYHRSASYPIKSEWAARSLLILSDRSYNTPMPRTRRYIFNMLTWLSLLLLLAMVGMWVESYWHSIWKGWVVPGPGNADFNARLANSPKGTFYVYRTNGCNIVISRGWADDFLDIPKKVVELAHDNSFIIAKQDEAMGRNIPNRINYWILDVRIPKRHGPYTQSEFVAQRKALGVSSALKLKDVYEYSP